MPLAGWREAAVRRLEFCDTPQHGSWLNIAENELSSLTWQGVSARRFGDMESLDAETSAWSTGVNDTQQGVDWQMNIDDARCKLKSVYPNIKLWQSSSRLFFFVHHAPGRRGLRPQYHMDGAA
ncbi:MAG: hypothetical protein AB7U20_24560 [Planctomycetaceae bacterium]